MPAKLRGFREAQRALQRVDKDASKDLKKKLREAAEPVRAAAERNVGTGIKTITPNWAKMRSGVTSSLVYVAPKQKGVGKRGDTDKRRPNLADLLAPEMEQALTDEEDEVVRTVDDVLAEMERDWARG